MILGFETLLKVVAVECESFLIYMEDVSLLLTDVNDLMSSNSKSKYLILPLRNEECFTIFGRIGTFMAFIGIRVISQAVSMRENRNELSCAQVDIPK